MELQLVQSLAINRSDYITNLYLSFVKEIFLNMRRKNNKFCCDLNVSIICFGDMGFICVMNQGKFLATSALSFQND
jgi:hypothetical protein